MKHPLEPEVYAWETCGVVGLSGGALGYTITYLLLTHPLRLVESVHPVDITRYVTQLVAEVIKADCGMQNAVQSLDCGNDWKKG